MCLHITPYLIKLDVSEEVLVVRSIKSGYWRWQTEILSEIANLPHSLRKNALQHIFEAQLVEDAEERAEMSLWMIGGTQFPGKIRIMVEFVLNLPKPILKVLMKIMKEIEMKFPEWEEKFWQWKRKPPSIISIISCLHESLGRSITERKLRAVQRMKTDEKKANALRKLVPYLSESLLQQAFIIAQAIESEYYRFKALVRIAPYLPKTQLKEILVAAQTIENESSRANVFVEVAPYFPEPLFKEMWEVIRTFKLFAHKSYQAQVLPELAPCLPESLLWEALEMEQKLKKEGWSRSLEILVSRLVKLPYESLVPFWQKLLENWTHYTRRDLLVDLRLFMPVIGELGGQKAIAELYHAIQDMERWWP